MKQLKATLFTVIFITATTGFGAGTETRGTTAPSNASITDSARNAASENRKGKIMNTVVGGVNLGIGAKCASSCPYGCCSMAPLFFLMGVQNLMQASAQGSSGAQANGTVYTTDVGLGGSGYDPDAINSINNDPEIRDGNAFAANVANGRAGFTYDPKTNTVTTAKGTKIKGSDLNSSSALAAAGLPKGAIDLMNSMEKDAVDRAMKKIEKLGLNTKISGEEGSVGGGGGGDSSGGGSGDIAGYGGGAGAGLGGKSGLGIDRDPAQVAGMQKNYNGEPIGVAGDSIFKMMNRRYKVKESQSSFLDESDVLMQK